MQVVAVLRQEFVVARIEGQTVAARLQLGHIVVALPVLVAGRVVRVEAEIVGAFEGFLGDGHCADNAKEIEKCLLQLPRKLIDSNGANNRYGCESALCCAIVFNVAFNGAHPLPTGSIGRRIVSSRAG